MHDFLFVHYGGVVGLVFVVAFALGAFGFFSGAVRPVCAISSDIDNPRERVTARGDKSVLALRLS